MAQDFYQILGVARDASQKDISTAYRRLARQYHPDVTGGDDAAESRFKEVNAAHSVLSNEEHRAAYDKWGDQWEHADQLDELQRQRGGVGGGMGGAGAAGFGGFGGPTFQGPGGNVHIDLGDLGDVGDLGEIFGNFFGGHGGAQPQPTRGRDIEHTVSVSLREAFHGATRTLQRGAGGSRLELSIPAGVADGQRIRFSGTGESSPRGPSGDLILIVNVEDDPVFERQGDHLRVPVDVPVPTAALGGEVAVRSLSGSGRLALRIPAGTQNGRVFRLTGQGMPRFKREGRGDILAEVRLQLPESLSDEQRELYRQLRDLEGGDA